MSSPAEGIKDILVTATVGIVTGSTGWQIKVGRLVEKPDTLIVCYDTPGRTPNPRWLLNYPSVQVMVRGAIDAYATGYAKALDVQRALLGIDPIASLNGDRWDGINGMGDVAFLRYDESNRPLFVVNFTIILEPANNSLDHRDPL